MGAQGGIDVRGRELAVPGTIVRPGAPVAVDQLCKGLEYEYWGRPDPKKILTVAGGHLDEAEGCQAQNRKELHGAARGLNAGIASDCMDKLLYRPVTGDPYQYYYKLLYIPSMVISHRNETNRKQSTNILHPDKRLEPQEPISTHLFYLIML